MASTQVGAGVRGGGELGEPRGDGRPGIGAPLAGGRVSEDRPHRQLAPAVALEDDGSAGLGRRVPPAPAGGLAGERVRGREVEPGEHGSGRLRQSDPDPTARTARHGGRRLDEDPDLAVLLGLGEDDEPVHPEQCARVSTTVIHALSHPFSQFTNRKNARCRAPTGGCLWGGHRVGQPPTPDREEPTMLGLEPARCPPLRAKPCQTSSRRCRRDHLEGWRGRLEFADHPLKLAGDILDDVSSLEMGR